MSGWLLDDKTIITRSDYLALITTLYQHLKIGPVSISEFSSRHGLSPGSLQQIIKHANVVVSEESNPSDGLEIHYLDHDRNFIFTQAYEDLLHGELKPILQQAQTKLDIDPRSLRGSPPKSLVTRACNELAIQAANGIKGTFHVFPNSITFTPDSYQLERRRILLEELKIGSVKYLPYDAINLMEVDDCSVREIVQIGCGDQALALNSGALSRVFFDRLKLDTADGIKNKGFAVVSLDDTISQEADAKMVRRLVQDSLKTDLEFGLLHDTFVSVRLRVELLQSVESNAVKAALDSWANAREPRLPAAVFRLEQFDELGLSAAVTQALLDSKTRKKVEDLFKKHYQRLDDMAVTNFAQFWTDRVTSKIRLHEEGAKAMQDPKLREDLFSILSQHITSNLLPESVKKAEGKQLIQGTRIIEQVKELSSSIERIKVQTSAPEIQFRDISVALRTLEKNLKFGQLSDERLAERKAQSCKDLARSVKKDDDGPKLFLTLLVLLLAKNGPGLVHATGKFAPRLLKQLSSVLEEGTLVTLRSWKDAAKAGNMAPEVKTEMRRIAEDSV
ncbi:MAG: hypothetical protein M1825_006031 [Sarcosagium campestre]|nr:MAG: hypothetical protein M1825_006031 [Sarcosagium campestre]